MKLVKFQLSNRQVVVAIVNTSASDPEYINSIISEYCTNGEDDFRVLDIVTLFLDIHKPVLAVIPEHKNSGTVILPDSSKDIYAASSELVEILKANSKLYIKYILGDGHPEIVNALNESNRLVIRKFWEESCKKEDILLFKTLESAVVKTDSLDELDKALESNTIHSIERVKDKRTLFFALWG